MLRPTVEEKQPYQVSPRGRKMNDWRYHLVTDTRVRRHGGHLLRTEDVVATVVEQKG